MYQSNLIIADKDMNILYVGDSIIPTVIKKNLSRPIGYPSGHLRDNNSFFIFIRDISCLSGANRSSLENICGEGLPQNGPAVVAGVFPEKEEKSLIKLPSEEDLDTGTLIDTVFHGRRFRLTYGKSSAASTAYSANFFIDDQQVSLSCDLSNDILIVLSDDSGITYYGKPQDMTAFFSGKEYPSYIDRNQFLSEPIHLSNVLDGNIFSALIKTMRTGISQIVRTEGNTCLISFYNVPDWHTRSDAFLTWKRCLQYLICSGK